MLAKHVRYREDEIPGRPHITDAQRNYTSRVGISTINSSDNIQRKKNFHLQQQEIRNKEAAIRLAVEEQAARHIIDEQNANAERESNRIRQENLRILNEDSSRSQERLHNDQNRSDVMPGELPPSPQGPARNTRSKSENNYVQSTLYMDSVFSTDVVNNPIPKTYKEAVSSPESVEWTKARQDEMKSHYENNTWKVMSNPPAGRDVIGSRWVFTRKTDAKGRIVQHKARLVAQGYSQRPGFDYDITYSPVVSLTTVRMLIAIATKEKLHLHQMDVKAAYLHGRIDNDIYMKQPPGFTAKSQPNDICKLNKSLYGLKQSGRLWYERLKQELERLDFSMCKYENCLFYHQDFDIIIAVYVDDILLIGKHLNNIDCVKDKLSRVFSMKDMGQASFRLGIQIKYDRENGKSQICLGSYIDKAIKI